MKEKDFEVIVPAYDALEAELEDILGGGCNKCKLTINCPGYVEKPPCTKEGEELKPGGICCEGLLAIRVENVYVCLEVRS